MTRLLSTLSFPFATATLFCVTLFSPPVEAAPATAAFSNGETAASASQEKVLDDLEKQVQKLNEKREWAQIEKQVEARWSQLLQDGVERFYTLLPPYVQALQKQGKDVEAATKLQSLGARFLHRMGSHDASWLPGMTADALQQAGENDKSLRWAKLDWVLCTYDEAKVRQSMQRLIRVANGADWNAKQGLALLEAQMKPRTGSLRSSTNFLPNDAPVSKKVASSTRGTDAVLKQTSVPAKTFFQTPLSQIQTPVFSSSTLTKALKNATQPQERITVYLASNQWLKAIDEAKKLGLSKPEGALEACRILRAWSGDLHEANAWLAFATSGTGRDPLSELREQLTAEQRAQREAQRLAREQAEAKKQKDAPKPLHPPTQSAYPTPTPVASPTPWVRRTTKTSTDSALGSATSSTRSSSQPLLPADAVAPIRLQAAVLPVVIGLMRADLLTGEEAYAKGALTLADIEEMVTGGGWQTGGWGMGDWGRIEGIEDPTLRREVMSVLWNHDRERFRATNLSSVPPAIRLWVGDMLYKRNDEKCVPILNSVLDEVKVPVKGESPLLFSTIERLAWFHRERGEHAKAINAWMRMERVHADGGWWVPDAYLESARLAKQMGDEKKAAVYYAQVSKKGDGVAPTIVAFDQAQALSRSGKYVEAQQALQKAALLNVNDPIRLATYGEMAIASYKAGDFKTAMSYSRKVTNDKNLLENGGSTGGVYENMASAVAYWAAQWERAPLVCEPDRLTIDTQKYVQTAVLRRTIFVRSFKPVSLVAKTDNPKFKVVSSKESKDGGYAFEQQIVLEIPIESLLSSSKATLTISSPAAPNFQLKVPIEISVSAAVQPETTSLFFGTLEAGKSGQKTLQMQGTKPFRVLDATSTFPEVTFGVSAAKELQMSHNIDVTLAPTTKGFVTGSIKVTVEVGTQKEVVEVQFTGRAD